MEKANQNDFTIEYTCIIKLINAAVNQVDIDLHKLKPNWEALYTLAEGLGVPQLLSYGIRHIPKEQRPGGKIQNKINQVQTQHIVRDTNQFYEQSLLMKRFSEEGIEHVVLKGVVMKKNYPQTDMRFSCDVDIMIHPQDQKKADEIMFELGYAVLERGRDKHDQFKKPPFMLVELHRNMVERKYIEFEYYKNVWNTVKPVKGYENSFMLSLEETYIYMVVHAVKHFYYSGMSITMVLDFYMFLKKYEDKLDWSYINPLFDKWEYHTFAKKVSELAFEWFSPQGKGFNPENDFALYILRSGAYGTTRNGIIMRMLSQEKEGRHVSKSKIIFRRIFPPKSKMIPVFPPMEKYPFLVPVAWFKMVINAVFMRRRLTLEVQEYEQVDEQQLSQMRQICNELELFHYKE